MNRRLLPLLVFTVCLCLEARAQSERADAPSSTPPWLPRGLLLATSLREGAVIPEARLQWQLVFFQNRRDTLGLHIEPAFAAAAVKPTSLVGNPNASMSSLQLYSLLLSLGYSNRSPSGVEWGFQVGTGPTWFNSRFQGGAKAKESYLVALLDGRARIGYRFAPIGLGLTVGYGDPYNYKRSSLARPYIGGLQLGVYADWR